MQGAPLGYEQAMKLPFPEQEQLKCPRCDSTHTKFCYYNNYNLSQPRYYCKNCRRYWTKGGSLRNIPIGGGSRKNAKRSSNNTKRQTNNSSDENAYRIMAHDSTIPKATTTTTTTTNTTRSSTSMVLESGSDHDPTRNYEMSVNQGNEMLGSRGSFSSLLASNGQLGNILDGFGPSSGSGFKLGENLETGHGLETNSGQASHGNNGEGNEGVDGGYWWGGGSNGWPELAIHAPRFNGGPTR